MRLLGIRTPEAPIDIKSVCTCLEFIHNHYHLSDKKTLYYFVRLSHQQPALSTCISPLNIFFQNGLCWCRTNSYGFSVHRFYRVSLQPSTALKVILYHDNINSFSVYIFFTFVPSACFVQMLAG